MDIDRLTISAFNTKKKEEENSCIHKKVPIFYY